MAEREIVGYHQDEDGHWVAELGCGHQQHLRHQPPWQNREWVLDEKGRKDKLGAHLPCHFCDMPTLPRELSCYKQTPEFDEHTVPAGLLSDHATRAGTWGRIVVLEGALLYTVVEPECQSWVLVPGVDGFIEPTVRHRVKPQGSARFRVEFWR